MAGESSGVEDEGRVMEAEEALEALLKALPHCCNCASTTAEVIDEFRWPLCETCWKAVPGSDDFKPLVDMRAAIALARQFLHERVTPIRIIPDAAQIPPPSTTPPDVMTPKQISSLEVRNKRLIRKIRRMREIRELSVKRMGFYAFAAGFIVGLIATAVVHYM